MKIKDLKSVDTPTVEALAKKYKVEVEEIESALAKGTSVELEHTTNKKIAREIALDHLGELLDYYDRLEKVEK